MLHRTGMRIGLLCGILLLVFNAHAQKENNYWPFGDHSALNFNSGLPVKDTSANPTTSQEGTAGVCSRATGQLLFYTDGHIVWDRNHNPMPNGINLLGNTNGTTTQGACIVPVLDSPGKYYLFTLSEYKASSSGKLYYSIVDTTLNNNLGDIVPGRKNIQMDDSLCESMIAIAGDNCDVWLLVHRFSLAVFKAYHITRNGLSLSPIVSTAGVQIQGRLTGLGAYATGCLAAAPNRKLIAIASAATNPPANVSHQSGVLVCKFDPSVGTVSNAIKVADSFPYYGVAFSPDNSKLYASAVYPGTATNNVTTKVRQFDVSTYDSLSIASRTIDVKSKVTSGFDIVQGLRLFNGVIYGVEYSRDSLDRINQPNLAGAACSYQDRAVGLLHKAFYALPNEVVYQKPVDTLHVRILDTLLCTQSWSLTLAGFPGYANYVWNDGVTGIVRTVTTPGTYWVAGTDLCADEVDTFVVRGAYVHFSLGDDTSLCTGQSLVLNVNIPDGIYQWSDGSSGHSLNITKSGIYWLTVNENGCSASDTIHAAIGNPVQDLGNDTVICTDQFAPMILQANVPPSATALWSDGSAGTTLAANDSGTYSVVVHDGACEGGDTIHIAKEICNCIFAIPNAFTPNDDGKNDIFRPVITKGCPVTQYQLAIYNRWGQRVFISTDVTVGWDGMVNGEPAEIDTYMFDVTFEGGTHGTKQYQKGDVTLIR